MFLLRWIQLQVMKKKIATSNFWIIYQGKGRIFLNTRMFEALKPSADYVAGCVMGIANPKNIDCTNYTASMSITGLAFVAHQQMTNNWSLSLSEFYKKTHGHRQLNSYVGRVLTRLVGLKSDLQKTREGVQMIFLLAAQTRHCKGEARGNPCGGQACKWIASLHS